MPEEWTNKLFFGDNLDILREHIPDESVDLIYLDPPFNSKATYNVLFKEKGGEESTAQITAFEDTWEWGPESEETYHELVEQGPGKLADLMLAFRSFLGQSDMMAYLTMMAIRMAELHRVLKASGSLYLHCDPTASHYLKIMLDVIFGTDNYRNDIIWVRSTNPKGSQHKARKYGVYTDNIFYYSKSNKALLDIESVRIPLTEKELEEKYDRIDDIGNFYDGPILRSASMGPRPNLVYEYKGYTPGPEGWRVEIGKLKKIDKKGNLGWVEGGKPYRKLRPEDDRGKPVANLWNDISLINSQARERLGYPTQKPEALLERIIKASSNEGDLVLDPFCGCGTSIAVAERLNRRWIGIDLTHLAISLMRYRLRDAFIGAFKSELSAYKVIGDPKDIKSAEALAKENRYQFETWAVGLVSGQRTQDKKKGADSGVDGRMYFFDDKSGKAKKIVIQVKSGHVTVSQIRDLKGVLEREKAVIGAFVTLKEPTKPMIKEAVSAGFYERAGPTKDTKLRRVPRIQILTIKELLDGKQVEYPQSAGATFKKAERKVKKGGLKQVNWLKGNS